MPKKIKLYSKILEIDKNGSYIGIYQVNVLINLISIHILLFD